MVEAKLQTKIYDQKGGEAGMINLPAKVFAAKWRSDLVHKVVEGMRSNKRAGTADTKGRGEVRGGGRKPWKQKGTGRARHGSSRSPIWGGGGVTHGPPARNNFCGFLGTPGDKNQKRGGGNGGTRQSVRHPRSCRFQEKKGLDRTPGTQCQGRKKFPQFAPARNGVSKELEPAGHFESPVSFNRKPGESGRISRKPGLNPHV